MKTNSTGIATRERKERQRETVSLRSLCSFVAIGISFLLAVTVTQAQVNSGSNGSDGAFNPTTNTVINMADHPDGIYHYTSVNISNGVTVTFIPNAKNTPIVWLVQSNVLINGTVSVGGMPGSDFVSGQGGPGGSPGGVGGHVVSPDPRNGAGLGGGAAGRPVLGYVPGSSGYYAGRYGNKFLVPLLGGSGGGGAWPSPNDCGGRQDGGGGGGSGGALLVASDRGIRIDGSIVAHGGAGGGCPPGGGGSGGGIRLVATQIFGQGSLSASAGCCYGGDGYVRLDTLDDQFIGPVHGYGSRGFQPIIVPTAGQLPELTVTSVGGSPVSPSPSGVLSTPDAVLSAQQNNPISIAVHCSNLPLNTQITVSVKPANGPAVSATGLNNTGTLASSTATVLINMPRGGGLIYATAATRN